MRTVLLVLAFSAFLGAQSAPDKIYEPGKDGTMPPQAINTPAPAFPPNARNKRPFHRVVTLDGYVGKDGRYHDATIAFSAGQEFDKEALLVIKKWKFHPCTREAQIVDCHLRVEMAWNLD